MRTPVLIGVFLLSSTSPVFGQATDPPILSADDVVARMVARDAQRESLERGYTGNPTQN